MSALNIILTETEGHIITDGAGSAFGVLTYFIGKVQAFPQLNCAIGLRGNVGMTNRIRILFETFNDQQTALDAMPGLFRKWFRFGAKVLPWLYNFEVAVVGFRDGKPFAQVISSVGRSGRPFEWLEIEGAYISPPVSIGSAAFRAGFDAGAVELIDAQRRANVVPIGGFVQVTTCTEAGIRTKVVKHYPDERGKKIAADTGLSVVQPSSDYRLG